MKIVNVKVCVLSLIIALTLSVTAYAANPAFTSQYSYQNYIVTEKGDVLAIDTDIENLLSKDYVTLIYKSKNSTAHYIIFRPADNDGWLRVPTDSYCISGAYWSRLIECSFYSDCNAFHVPVTDTFTSQPQVSNSYEIVWSNVDLYSFDGILIYDSKVDADKIVEEVEPVDMNTFHKTIFDSLVLLLSSEPFVYLLSIIGLLLIVGILRKYVFPLIS